MAKKYIDAEKLIALIDAKLKDLGLSGSVWVGRNVLQDLKNDILTSLQQEQPEVDLERDAVQFCFDKGLNVTPYQAKTIARHFYELGKNSK